MTMIEHQAQDERASRSTIGARIEIGHVEDLSIQSISLPARSRISLFLRYSKGSTPLLELLRYLTEQQRHRHHHSLAACSLAHLTLTLSLSLAPLVLMATASTSCSSTCSSSAASSSTPNLKTPKLPIEHFWVQQWTMPHTGWTLGTSRSRSVWSLALASS